MRFRGSIEFWVEVDSLDQVEHAIGAAGQAVHAALGGTAVDDPDSGAMWGSFYEPIDDAGRAALDKDDLGHGISGSTFRYHAQGSASGEAAP